ncbi:hypothetical protein EBS40_02535 [bacterium]|nr:hypothetical protein [bacterium]
MYLIDGFNLSILGVFMSIKKEPLIIWQKWLDPFGDDSEESKWTDYENEHMIDTKIDEENKPIIKGRPVKVIASPMGLIPYSEHTASGRIFNFWTGHSNFNLSDNIIDYIEQIDGVETLDVFTRYRFRIAIGKCFDDSIVMNSINQKLYSILNNHEH